MTYTEFVERKTRIEENGENCIDSECSLRIHMQFYPIEGEINKKRNGSVLRR